MTEMSYDDFEKLKLNASGLILTSAKSINVKERLENIANKIYTKKYKKEYFNSEDSDFALLTFEVEKGSYWKESYRNITHHYMFIYQNNEEKNYVFIGFSDLSKHKKILNNRNPKSEERIEKIDSNTLKKAFLTKEILSMWMSNHSKKTLYKPNNKVLIGNVGSSLNPVMDSSFSFSSAKGKIENNKIIISPKNSKFFLKKSHSIDNLKNLLNIVAHHLNNIKPSDKFPFEYLLEEVDNINFDKNLGELEDFTFQSPDFLQSQGIFNEELTYEDYDDLIDDIVINIIPKPKDKPKNLPHPFFAALNVSYRGIIFTVKFYQLNKGFYGCKYPSNKELNNNFPQEAKIIRSIFKNSYFLKFYFKTGYILDGTEVYKNEYKNINYNEDKILANKFNNINIKEEKPFKLSESRKKIFDETQIGKQKSLFCWTVKYWKYKLLNTNKKAKNELLICDDGSNEIADFIHLVEFDDNKYILNIIHIKASKSKEKTRQVSVGSFDLVLTQAIKNARYSNISELIEKLKQTPNKIDYVWENNKLNDKLKRTDFIQELKNIEKNAFDYQTNIIVIQPHMIKSKYNNLKASSNTKKLLNTLLHAANSAISGFSSTLYIMVSE